MTQTSPIRLSFRPGIGIILLFALMVFGLTATSMISILLTKINNPAAVLRITAVIQDLLVFIIPAIVTAMLATRLPARFLRLETYPTPIQIVFAIAAVVFSMPLINLVMEWNNSITLPQSMSHIEQIMRNLEEAADNSVSALIGGSSPGALLISLLIVGVLAGFSEEIFFRGALQRLFGFAVGHHAAIWITAFIFSAIHLQFYGFFPRLLLGALFGYLYYWSGSLTVPVIAHIFNNSMVVVVKWLMERGAVSRSIENIGGDGSGMDIAAVIVSVILTVAVIYLFRKTSVDSHAIQD